MMLYLLFVQSVLNFWCNYTVILPRLAQIQILCGEQAMLFRATDLAMNLWPAHKISVGKCQLNHDYSINAYYDECGLIVTETGM